MGALRLPSKIILAVVWLEKSSDCSISVESEECSARSIKPGDSAVISYDLEDITTNRPIAKPLRSTEIFLFTDISEFRAVFCKMLVQLIPGAKTDSRINLILCRLLRVRDSRWLGLFVARAKAKNHQADYHRPDGDLAKPLHVEARFSGVAEFRRAVRAA